MEAVFHRRVPHPLHSNLTIFQQIRGNPLHRLETRHEVESETRASLFSQGFQLTERVEVTAQLGDAAIRMMNEEGRAVLREFDDLASPHVQGNLTDEPHGIFGYTFPAGPETRRILQASVRD